MKFKIKEFIRVVLSLALIYACSILGSTCCFAQTCGGCFPRLGILRFRQYPTTYCVQRQSCWNRCYGYYPSYNTSQCRQSASCIPCGKNACGVVKNEASDEIQSISNCSQCQAGKASCNTGTCPLGSAVAETVKKVAEVPKLAIELTSELVWLAEMNAVRARYGLQALKPDTSLFQGAQSHCHNMAYYRQVYHQQGCGYEIAAQNNGVGVQHALQQWLNSSGHRAIMLNPNLTYAGVASYRDNYGYNWCVARFR